MNTEIKREISRVNPGEMNRIKGGEPLFTAYGCVLLERNVVDKYYVYTAVNLTSGGREVIARRVHPLRTSQVESMAEKIRQSKVAGAGRLQADRKFGDQMTIDKTQNLLIEIFNEILPDYGFSIRTEQIELAQHILDSLYRRNVTLAEAEVGTGKTLAYLVAAVLAKRGRLNGYWNMSFYTGTPYVEMAHMPIVIATSSIALQKAIVTDYIPQISKILLKHGIIKKPLTFTLRKGREHYVCAQRLRSHILSEHNVAMKKILKTLLDKNAPIDLAEIDGLTPHVKRKISVMSRCDENCPNRDACHYLAFRQSAQSPRIDIQVCNHNYLLADTLRRKAGDSPLIPNYQMLIIDEAHKFLGAARQMYGVELSRMSFADILDCVKKITFKHKSVGTSVINSAHLLTTESDRLFRNLLKAASQEDDESKHCGVELDTAAIRHIQNIRNEADYLIDALNSAIVSGAGEGVRAQILWEAKQIRRQVGVLTRHDSYITWIEPEQDDDRLCGIPKNLDEQLFDDLWNKGIPTILTSGTLSAGGDFSRIKQTLGLNYTRIRLTETSKTSPFDYRKNSLLYISKHVPYPDQRNREYILAVANEVEQLIHASHGHAAVLFTSYKAMDMVWEHISERGLQFPLFRLDRGGVREIERFKQSNGGVLFASGSMWEGIDIPGDALSMLIIVKLPFAVPDPISEYERTLYKDMDEYIRCVIIPDMLIKLKQGHGRLIRTERDTGAIALLDCRAGEYGSYNDWILTALPECRTTTEITVVSDFFSQKKSPDYFAA